MNDVPQATSPQEPPFMTLRVASKELLAQDIWRYDLVQPDGGALPEFTAGAHIPVQTPAGSRRSYSLCNDPERRDIYQIAIKRDGAGRGGSISMVDGVNTGDNLPVGPPANHFELAPRASRFVFVAGGIGITPILSMMRHLKSAGRGQFVLYYCTRNAEQTAFRKELASEFPGQVRLHHDLGDSAKALDLWPVLEKPSQAHIYCCGPRGLMNSVRDMSGHWPSGSVHFESFGVDATTRAANAPFKVRIRNSEVALEVGSGQTILEVLRANGYRVPSSCESGVCGACKTALLAGKADHRDMVLTDHEKDRQVMVCVSRAKSPELVLDLP
jgi:phthalate 4,5-dioxygenase reductase subunit